MPEAIGLPMASFIFFHLFTAVWPGRNYLRAVIQYFKLPVKINHNLAGLVVFILTG